MKSWHGMSLPLIAAIAVALVFTGCATKKYVRNTVSPVEQRAGELEKKTTAHAASIEELEKGVSRADERAQGADAKAQEAARAAAKADESAARAGQGADEAKTMAGQEAKRAGDAERSLGNKIENVDSYKLVSEEKVLFGLNRSELSDEAKAQLDAAVQKVSSAKHFVIEVQGYTDKTGSREHNLELSRRRAAAVVRYLTATRGIPLYRVHTMGYGPESPVADNSTRDGRKQNRRVDVKFYVVDLGAPATVSSLTGTR